MPPARAGGLGAVTAAAQKQPPGSASSSSTVVHRRPVDHSLGDGGGGSSNGANTNNYFHYGLKIVLLCGTQKLQELSGNGPRSGPQRGAGGKNGMQEGSCLDMTQVREYTLENGLVYRVHFVLVSAGELLYTSLLPNICAGASAVVLALPLETQARCPTPGAARTTSKALSTSKDDMLLAPLMEWEHVLHSSHSSHTGCKLVVLPADGGEAEARQSPLSPQLRREVHAWARRVHFGVLTLAEDKDQQAQSPSGSGGLLERVFLSVVGELQLATLMDASLLFGKGVSVGEAYTEEWWPQELALDKRSNG